MWKVCGICVTFVIYINGIICSSSIRKRLSSTPTGSENNHIILISSHSPSNTSSNDESDDDQEDQISLPITIFFKWLGYECFHLLVFEAKSVLDILKNSHVSFWRYSQLPKILVFVPNDWNWGALIMVKETGGFNGFTVNIVFLVTNKEGSTIKHGLLCYMCSKATSINWVEKSYHQNPWEAGPQWIQNADGYNRKLYLKYGVDLTNLEEDRNCETAMYFLKTRECGVTTIILQMTKTKLNMSVERVLDLDDVETSMFTSVVVPSNIPSDMNTLGRGKLSLIFRDQTTGKLFYCTGSETFEPLAWDFFIRIIRIGIWGCILTIGLIYAILTGSLFMGLRTFLFLAGQGLPPIFRRKLLLSPLLPLVLVTNWYLSILTMDVLVPPSVWVVEKNKQLFDLGFKFVIPSNSALPVVREKANRSMEKYHIPWDPNYFLARPDIIQFGKDLQPDFFIKLATVNGIYHTHKDAVILMKKLKLISPRSNRYGNATCSVVKEDWDDQLKFFWLVGGYLAPQFVTYASRLVESGFNHFWTLKKHLNVLSNMQLTKYCRAHANVCGSETVMKMGINSSIQIIFRFLVIFSAFATFSFVFEIVKGSRERLIEIQDKYNG